MSICITLQEELLVTDLLYFSKESVGTLNLPLAQLSEGHLLEVDLKTRRGSKRKNNFNQNSTHRQKMSYDAGCNKLDLSNVVSLSHVHSHKS